MYKKTAHYGIKDQELVINAYKDLLDNKIKKMPNGTMNKECLPVLGRFLFNEILKWDRQTICDNLNYSLLHKHRLRTVLNVFHDIGIFIDTVFPEYDIKKWELKNSTVGVGYWNDDNKCIEAIKWFVDKLVKEHNITKFHDIIKFATDDALNKYRIYTVYMNRFNCDIYKMIDFVYPGEWMPWELNQVRCGFWDNVNNIISALEWLYQKLDYNNYDEFLLNTDQNDFIDNKLGKLMSHFNSSVFNVINYIYPNKFYVWEFKTVPNNYWTVKENRINAMKQFIENKLNLEISEVPDKITLPFIKNIYPKFMYPLVTYYKSRIDDWLNECYPGVFSSEDFKKKVASDGTILDSKEELLIHEWLIKNISNVKYIDRTDKQNRFCNQEDDENYYADWIINSKVIVEYFGMYNPLFKNEIYQKYMAKADRKIKYYKSLSEYDFIDIYHIDLKNKMNGLKQKLCDKRLLKSV